MTDPDPVHNTLPLALSAAVLSAPPPLPHPDSEEAVRHERQRVARELDVIHKPKGPTSCVPMDPPQALPSPNLRSRAPALASRPSDISTAADASVHRRQLSLRRQVPHWYDPIVKFWTTHVSITIDEGAHRDHLALERTFLGYLRTSLTLNMTGVVTAQLFRLQHSINPNPSIGFFVLGVPLSVAFIGSGMIVLLIGAYRFWRQQNALIRGKVHAGGWEITGLMVLSVLVCTGAFVLTTAVDIEKSYF